jgi:hypothetical protein
MESLVLCNGYRDARVTIVKISRSSFISTVFAVSALTLPSLWPASALGQPAPFYPIGTSNGTNAKVSSRLFEIDGKVGPLDYGVFHTYPNSRGYSSTWGVLWIQVQDAIGKAAGKPVILEQYGRPHPNNHTGTEVPWQDAVLKSGLAANQIWRFGSDSLSVPGATLWDANSVYS